MDESPAHIPPGEPGGEESQEGQDGLTRRDFLMAAAILTGSMLMMLSRCNLPYAPDLPPIPPEFKRFILTEQSPKVTTEQIIVALGSQCPDLKCALWWVDTQEFEFFETVGQIDTRYVQNGRSQFHWLD